VFLPLQRFFDLGYPYFIIQNYKPEFPVKTGTKDYSSHQETLTCLLFRQDGARLSLQTANFL
jgi:hypothetical protein